MVTYVDINKKIHVAVDIVLLLLYTAGERSGLTLVQVL